MLIRLEVLLKVSGEVVVYKVIFCIALISLLHELHLISNNDRGNDHGDSKTKLKNHERRAQVAPARPLNAGPLQDAYRPER